MLSAGDVHRIIDDARAETRTAGDRQFINRVVGSIYARQSKAKRDEILQQLSQWEVTFGADNPRGVGQ